MDGKMNPRYSYVIMVSVCPILTAVRWPSRGSAIYSYVASKDNNLHWLTCRAKATDLVLCYRFPLLFILLHWACHWACHFLCLNFFRSHCLQDFSFREVSFAGFLFGGRGLLHQLRFFSTGPPRKGLIAVDICNFSKLFLLSCVLYMSRPVGIIGTTLFFAMSFMNWLIVVFLCRRFGNTNQIVNFYSNGVSAASAGNRYVPRDRVRIHKQVKRTVGMDW